MYKKVSLLMILGFTASCVPVGDVKDSKLSFRAPSSVVEQAAIRDYNSEIQMAPRSYVESVLLDVFDAKGTAAAAYITSDIYQKIEFGGACDLYAASDVGLQTATVEYSTETCTNAIDAVQKSTNNPMRYSLTTKVCEQLVIDKDRLGAVRKKIYPKNVWEEPNASSVEVAWGLFFPATPVSNDIKSALVAIGKSTNTNEQAWQAIVLTLCMSPEWQTF